MVGKKTIVLFVLIALCVPLFASGGRETPTPAVDTSGPYYISPNGDGVQDTATIDFSVTIYVRSDSGFIPQYGLRITDDAGSVIKEVIATERSDLNWFLRLFRNYQAFTLTRNLTWDGKDEAGAVVPEGQYHFDMWVSDETRERTWIPVDHFYVDLTAPRASILIARPIFSPNGDGYRDTVAIDQFGSSESRWQGRVLDATQAAVKTFTWNTSSPPSFSWDGLTDAGARAADAAYTYVLTGTDLAGNSVSVAPAAITLDTRPTPLRADLSYPVFSPNGDGVQDEQSILLSQTSDVAIVSWNVAVLDATNASRRAFQGGTTFPASIAFDGKDTAGQALPDGRYQAVFTIVYANGSSPTSTANMIIDTVAPVVTLDTENTIFSPNGDEVSDQAVAQLEVSEVSVWQATITDSAGNTVISVDSEETSSRIVWNGMDAGGATVADGSYAFSAAFTDLGGNRTIVAPVPLVVDTTPAVLRSAFTPSTFSPDGDGTNDATSFGLSSNEDGAWTIEFVDPSGSIIYSGESSQRSLSLPWDGTVDGEAARNGTYRAQLVFTDLAGNVTHDSSASVRIAIGAPDATITPVVAYFSPNGDGVKDEAVVRLETATGVWSWTIADADRRQVAAGSATTSTAEARWDGTNLDVALPGAANAAAETVTGALSQASGIATDRLAEGSYFLTAILTMPNGNSYDYPAEELVLDVTPPVVTVTCPVRVFSPNGDGRKDELEIGFAVNEAATGSGSLEAAAGTQVFEGDFAFQTGEYVFRGMDASGNPLPDGSYTFRAVFTDLAGNSAAPNSETVAIDTVAPALTIRPRAAFLAFANGASTGTLSTALVLNPADVIASWSLAVTPASGGATQNFTGTGSPTGPVSTPVAVSGRLTGLTVPFRYAAQAEDEAGNVAAVTYDGAGGILVMTDARGTYLADARVIFRDYLATLNSAGAEWEQRNRGVVNQVAALMAQFPELQVLLEGHAENYQRTGTAAYAAEEARVLPVTTRRAETVRAAIVALGVPASRLAVQGFGSAFPAANPRDNALLWQNRRVIFAVRIAP